MPKAVRVKRGEEYLHDVPLPELEAMYRRERPGKSGDMLQATMPRATMRLGRSAALQGAWRAPPTGGSAG